MIKLYQWLDILIYWYIDILVTKADIEIKCISFTIVFNYELETIKIKFYRDRRIQIIIWRILKEIKIRYIKNYEIKRLKTVAKSRNSITQSFTLN